jgi:hypothetical protein
MKFLNNYVFSLFHELARHKIIKHYPCEETKKEFCDDLQFDENGFIEVDTYTFAKEILKRFKKEIYNSKKHFSIENFINEQNINCEVIYNYS